MKHEISDKKKQRIKRRVIKGGVRAARRQDIGPSDSERVAHIRVQVMSPVLRLFLGFTGLALCVIPFVGWFSVWWLFLFIPVGLIFLLVAINGRKKEVAEAILEAGGEITGDILTEVIGEILSGL